MVELFHNPPFEAVCRFLAGFLLENTIFEQILPLLISRNQKDYAKWRESQLLVLGTYATPSFKALI